MIVTEHTTELVKRLEELKNRHRSFEIVLTRLLKEDTAENVIKFESVFVNDIKEVYNEDEFTIGDFEGDILLSKFLTDHEGIPHPEKGQVHMVLSQKEQELWIGLVMQSTKKRIMAIEKELSEL